MLVSVVLCLSEPANAQAFSVNGDNGSPGNCPNGSPPYCYFTIGAGTFQGSPGNSGPTAYSDFVTVKNLSTTASLQLSVSVSTTAGGSWLSASASPNPIAKNSAGVVSISINAVSLHPGASGPASYSGTVTISGGGTTVTVSVGLYVTGINLSLSPTSEAVTLAANAMVTKNINFLPSGGVSATVTSNQSFVTVSNNGGSGFTITINAPPSSATAIVTVQNGGGNSSSTFVAVALPVTVTVMAPSNPVPSPGSLSFSAYQGRANPAPQVFSVTTSDGSSKTVSVTGVPSFVSVSPGSGTASSSPASFTVAANTSAMRLGSNTGAIALALANGGTTSVSVNATLSPFSIGVSPNSPSPVLLPQGKSQVIGFQVSTVDGAQAPVSVTTNANWLNVNSSAITAPASLNATVSAGSMAAGTYSGSVSFACSGSATCAAINVPVTLTVSTLATLSASPTSLNFSVASGVTLPAPQTITVTSSDQTFQTFGFTYSPQGSWLSVTANQSITPATLTATIISLPAQNSTGSITITPADGAGVVTIPISLAVPSNQPVIPSGGAIFASSFGAFSTITSGGFVEIYGSNLSTTTTDWGSSFVNGVAPTSLSGVKVQIGGQPAFVAYVSPGQVNILAPSNMAAGGTVPLELSNTNGTSATVMVNAAPLQPGLLAPANFKINGSQYVFALLTDGNFALPTGSIGSSHPAKPGDVIVMYGLGFGPVTPSIPVGTIETQANKLQNPLQVFFGNMAATVQYDGLAPSFAGLYQFNVTVPAVPDNNALPLTFNLGGVAGTQTLFIAVHQ